MEGQLLRDPGIFPDEGVLEDALKGSYPAFEQWIMMIRGPEFGLVPEWRYYNDGKAWLCKVVDKKKTVMWLSVWDGFFRVSFFFTEKHRDGIAALDIDEGIKAGFAAGKPVGKLIPLILDVRSSRQLPDALAVAGFKKKA